MKKPDKLLTIMFLLGSMIFLLPMLHQLKEVEDDEQQYAALLEQLCPSPDTTAAAPTWLRKPRCKPCCPFYWKCRSLPRDPPLNPTSIMPANPCRPYPAPQVLLFQQTRENQCLLT